MRKILLIAGAAVALVAAAPAQAPKIMFDEVMGICKATFIDNPDAGRAQFNALPEATKPQAALLCLAYRKGALDLLDAAGRKPEHNA
jgi:hypothetical protein